MSRRQRFGRWRQYHRCRGTIRPTRRLQQPAGPACQIRYGRKPVIRWTAPTPSTGSATSSRSVRATRISGRSRRGHRAHRVVPQARGAYRLGLDGSDPDRADCLRHHRANPRRPRHQPHPEYQHAQHRPADRYYHHYDAAADHYDRDDAATHQQCGRAVATTANAPADPAAANASASSATTAVSDHHSGSADGDYAATWSALTSWLRADQRLTADR